MSNNANIDPEYQKIIKKHQPPRKIFLNCLVAFTSGGGLCLAAEFISRLFTQYTGLDDKSARDMTLTLVILLTALVTGLGFYDSMAQKLGAGLAVPISGFANSITAASMDNKSEGYVLGLASCSFKLAGAVIVYGTVSAFFMALIIFIVGVVK